MFPCLGYNYQWTAFFFLWLSGLCDVLDGTIAREKNMISVKGAIYDIFCDRIVEVAIIFGLYSVSPCDRATLSLVMLGSILLCVTSFLVVGIFTDKATDKSCHYSPGLIERIEAFLLFSLMILLPNFFEWLALIFSVLVSYTAFARIVLFKQMNS